MAGNWRKSSYSFSNGGCIEAADWRKSRWSKTGNCIEVASGVAVRDTQDREGPVLKFSAAQWRAFTAALPRFQGNARYAAARTAITPRGAATPLGLDTGKHEAYASERIP